jgi:O-antigen/teichoic acid export membrane protein
MNLYAAYPWGCGIVADPPGCTQSYTATPEDPANCVRVDNAGIYSWALLTGWIWATFLFIFVAMVIIYRSVRTRESKSDQYDFGRRMEAPLGANAQTDVASTCGGAAASTCTKLRAKKARSRSREFANQAFLYCLFFFVTFTFGSINISIVNWGPDQPYMPLMMIQTLFGPLQ